MEPGGQSSYHPKRPVQYTDIIAYVEDKYGAKIRGEYIACVKRMCGLEVAESNNKSKNGNPRKKKKQNCRRVLAANVSKIYHRSLPLNQIL